ncbi:MAG: dihydrodipicolinate synthase family protein [Promethearchaeota archaeon]
MQIRGVVVPSLTFFNDDYKINITLQTLLIRHLLVNGADSLYLFSNIGEGDFFADKIEEKIKLINLSLDLTGRKTPIILGFLSSSEENQIDHIEDLGKRYHNLNFVINSPFLEKKPSNLLKDHFKNVFETINVKNSLYIYNNPQQFAGNAINPEIVDSLLKYPNFNGIIDTFDNINFCKTYVNLINDNFSLFCAKEDNFQQFFQLIPLNLRKNTGIIPSISNLVNICSKLYFCALEEKILELYQIQEQLNDIISKVYDVKSIEGKELRGLKYAFLFLYKDILPFSIDELNILSPRFSSKLDEITKGRIEAIVNYLLNQKFIYQLYTLGKEDIYQLDEIIKRFSHVEILVNQGKIKRILGPFDGENNTIYRVNFENSEMIFRFRTSKFFPYEDIIKEKLLFPILDHKLNPTSTDFRENIKHIITNKIGEYLFDKQNPPIIPVKDLIYYDETKENVPYIFTVQEYIKGESLEYVLNQYTVENSNFSKLKFINLFSSLAEVLLKLHNIKFSFFQDNIIDIGKKATLTWLDVFKARLETQIQEAKRNKFELEKEVEIYFKDYESLIEDEDEAILVHNDFQWKNIIVNNEKTQIKINGIIDFDEWAIGVRALDFVKMELITFKLLNNENLKNKFYETYSKSYRIDNDFKKKIELYCIYSLLRDYNNEMLKSRNIEHIKLSEKFKTRANYYLNEIKQILEIE